MEIERIAPIKIYLAGAIRDERHEDVEWREEFISHLGGECVFLNPIGGKTYNKTTKEWVMSGIPATADAIVGHDLWCVSMADIVVFNFNALSEKYPNIGTLVEFGYARGRGDKLLRYSILDPSYTGHENQAMFKLHPFLEKNSTLVFPSALACRTFLSGHLKVLSGAYSRFGGNVK
jgi:nucleoside 2-deoxyribosyltransferase